MRVRRLSFLDLNLVAHHRRETCMVFMVAMLALLAPNHADACSYPQCLGPRAHTAASVPSNAGGVWIFPGNNAHPDRSAYPEAIELRVSDSDGELALETALVDRTVAWDIRAALRADLTLYEGQTLLLMDPVRECSPPPLDEEEPLEPVVVASWAIGPPADKPALLGTLDVTLEGNGEGRSAGGAECFSTFPAATARVSLVASEEAEPWLDVVVYETLVDGQLHHPLKSDWYLIGTDWEGPFGGSWKGRGVDELFTRCPPVGDHEKARNSCRPKDRRPKRFWAAPGVVHRDA
jgi:hypothetical protein